MEQHQVAQHQQQPSSCSRSTATCLIYANRHVPKFLALSSSAESEDSVDERGNKGDEEGKPAAAAAAVQVVTDGATLTAANLLGRSSSACLSLHRPIWIVDSAESIGMKLPPPPPPRASRHNDNPHEAQMMTVRDIADLVGHDLPVAVIDVEHQEELEGWTWADMIDYFEDEERLAVVVPKQISMVEDKGRPAAAAATTATTNTTRTPASSSRSNREHVRRQASVDFLNKTRHRVLNQISFEFSHCTELRRLVRSPQFVRELDWIDRAWPRPINTEPQQQQQQQAGAYYHYPKVQYYCLTSAAGCFTDFHIDFGGSSVWYHVLKGSKVFCVIPPTQENLKVYEQWLGMRNQEEVFLPDLLSKPEQMAKVRLQQNQTFIVPSGWIHAVYTPEDSLVFGGNFLHGLDMRLQLEVHSMEERTRVRDKFRFPYFVPIQFYAGGMYLDKLRRGYISQRELDELPVLMEALEQWWKVQSKTTSPEKQENDSQSNNKEPTIWGAAMYAARQNGCSTVEAFLSELREEHARVLRGLVCRSTGTVNSEYPSLRVRIKIKTSTKPKTVVSATSHHHLSYPSFPRTKPREDTNSFVDEKEVLKDDEWLPAVGEASPDQVRVKKHSRGAKQQPQHRTISSKTKAKVSVRQRLLKKAKW